MPDSLLGTMLSVCQCARGKGLTSADNISSIIHRISSGLKVCIGSNSLERPSEFGPKMLDAEEDEGPAIPVSIFGANSSIEFIASTRGRSDFLIISPTGRPCISFNSTVIAYLM